MRPLGLFSGSIKHVRTVLSDGRSDRTRFRCIRPSMSRADRDLTLVREIGILELLGLFGDMTHSRGKATQVPRGPLGPEGMGDRMGSQGRLRQVGAVKETELLLGEAVRGTGAPRLPSHQGDRPIRDKPIYFGYCYDWMCGKCTAQQCKYLHQKPPPGTKPITPRSTAGPVVEDEEGDTPRSPTPSPPDREARRLDSPAQGLTDF